MKSELVIWFKKCQGGNDLVLIFFKLPTRKLAFRKEHIDVGCEMYVKGKIMFNYTSRDGHCRIFQFFKEELWFLVARHRGYFLENSKNVA